MRPDTPLEIHPVPQEHALGCGVACVAARCGIDYRSALALFDAPENAWLRGYFCPELVAALARAGLRYEFAEAGSLEATDDKLARPGTIVFVGPCSEYPAGHYLIRARSGWMNPWSSFPSMMPVRAEVHVRHPGSITHILYERIMPEASGDQSRKQAT